MEKINRKSMLIRESGRSTDFISPSFGHGCLFNCTYCYMKRHKPKGLDIAKNTGDILTAINNHSMFIIVDKPNQTHNSLITYDISCNEDFALHLKYHNWKYIFDFFKDSPKAMGSFATKYVNVNLLDYNPENKIRIRFSLMPQKYSDLLEPNTSKIVDRIKAIDAFIDAGYDVHINNFTCIRF
jgi:spore photoproduct lyase